MRRDEGTVPGSEQHYFWRPDESRVAYTRLHPRACSSAVPVVDYSDIDGSTIGR